ncbi:hypothetical protein [Actinophytocola gossypii]|uniref:MFS transporter n=1 Tax=Actinophytocola gossypii TaxID=2812003 RepID=A0ABT2JFB6_9PSEU|nr:hypothetical protein [Actinophytocola gossypii]MCT2586568.1 hypothetical protein [Actinophytocola gossypii]
MGRPTSTSGTHDVPGWLLGACVAALTVTAHGSAGGTVADSSLTALLATLLAWGGASLARRGGLVTLVGVLAATQAAQHVLLTEIAHVHAPAESVNGWLMLGTHAAATVLSAVLLVRAGGAIARIAAAVRWLAGRLQALCPAPPAGPARPIPARVTSRPGVLLEVTLRRAIPRRGPPVHS